MTAAAPTILQAEHDRLSATGGGALARAQAPWTAEASRWATAAWRTRGLPTRQAEAWKYTALGFLAEASLAMAARPLPSENMKIKTVNRFADSGSGDLVFYNGHFIPELSRLPSDRGVRIVRLADSSAGDLQPFAAAFTASRFASGPWFDALNASFAQDGLVISFAASVRLEAPIILTFISSAAAPWTASSSRVLVRFAPLSEGAVVERHVTLGDGPCLTFPSTDVVVEDGARATYARVQAEGPSSAHFGSLLATLGRDAFLESLQVSTGARLSRQELSVRLLAPGGETRVDGLYLTQGTQHVDNRTSIEHVAGETTSAQLYKGILTDESRAVFNGRIRIEPQAQKSNASQLCRNLSLSKRCEIDAKPELEIFADDVKASHGATVGQMDPEQLFYFQTRAISRPEAAQAVARGFAQDVSLRMQNPVVRAFVAREVDGKFERMKASVR